MQAVALSAQDAQAAAPDLNTVLGPPTSVHGVVMNAASGEPLPRALVQINGGAGQAVLTDGDGRFDVSGVPLGPNMFQLTRPGFEDAAGADKNDVLRDLRGFAHDVFVTANMPALTFFMRPTNSIRGHIELSTGDVAVNIGVVLLARQIQNGRASWRPTGGIRANADGNFHFAHLDDGDYVLKAGPAPEAEMTEGQPASDLGRAVPWNGYPEIYYPDARDFSGAAHLHLAGGQQGEANITMPLEPFHLVTASIQLPPELRDSKTGNMVVAEIIGVNGMQVPYGSQYDGEKNELRGRLPDGNYVVRVTASAPDRQIGRNTGSYKLVSMHAGQVDVTVAGHPVTRLRIPVGPAANGPLQVMVTRSAQSSSGAGAPGNHGEVFVEISQAGPLSDGMQAAYAQGSGPGALDTIPPSPGKYWVHTIIADSSLCEDSFTAGGANLGREPLVVGQGGATAPLTLSLRDDCGTLNVSLPPTAAAMTAGEEPSYTVYLVPDFDTTVGADSRTMRASTGASFTFNSLTPGNYHVYVFNAPVNLEYRNRDVLAGYHSQAVTVASGENAGLVLEVPAQ
jgi:hypothetical protein